MFPLHNTNKPGGVTSPDWKVSILSSHILRTTSGCTSDGMEAKDAFGVRTRLAVVLACHEPY